MSKLLVSKKHKRYEKIIAIIVIFVFLFGNKGFSYQGTYSLRPPMAFSKAVSITEKRQRKLSKNRLEAITYLIQTGSITTALSYLKTIDEDHRRFYAAKQMYIYDSTLNKYAFLLAYQGRMEDALALITDKQEMPSLLRANFFYYLNNGDVLSAVKVAEKCILEFPDAWIVRSADFVKELLNSGYVDEASFILHKLYQVRSKIYPQSLLNIAYLFKEYDDWPKALDVYKHMPIEIKEKDLAPELYGPYTGLFIAEMAKELISLGRIEEAIALAYEPGLEPYRLIILAKIAPSLLTSAIDSYQEKGKHIIEALKDEGIMKALADKRISMWPGQPAYPYYHYSYMVGVWAEAMFAADEYESVAMIAMDTSLLFDMDSILRQMGYDERVDKLIQTVIRLSQTVETPSYGIHPASKLEYTCHVSRGFIRWSYEKGSRKIVNFINDHLDNIEPGKDDPDREAWLQAKLTALACLREEKSLLEKEYQDMQTGDGYDKKRRGDFLKSLTDFMKDQKEDFPADKHKIPPNSFYETNYKRDLERSQDLRGYSIKLVINNDPFNFSMDRHSNSVEQRNEFSNLVESASEFIERNPYALADNLIAIITHKLMNKNFASSSFILNKLINMDRGELTKIIELSDMLLAAFRVENEKRYSYFEQDFVDKDMPLACALEIILPGSIQEMIGLLRKSGEPKELVKFLEAKKEALSDQGAAEFLYGFMSKAANKPDGFPGKGMPNISKLFDIVDIADSFVLLDGQEALIQALNEFDGTKNIGELYSYLNNRLQIVLSKILKNKKTYDAEYLAEREASFNKALSQMGQQGIQVLISVLKEVRLLKPDDRIDEKTAIERDFICGVLAKLGAPGVQLLIQALDEIEGKTEKDALAVFNIASALKAAGINTSKPLVSAYKRIRITKTLSIEDRAKTMLSDAMRKVPAHILAKELGLNIKLARFLTTTSKILIRNLLDDANRKDKLNEIAYNLNREVTLHPAERRLGEDEKYSLFDHLLGPLIGASDIEEAKRIFDLYYRNNPEQYQVNIQVLNELLEFFSLEEIERIVMLVRDDPKQSLDELTKALKEHISTHENAAFIKRRMSWILANLFVLQDKIESLKPMAKSLQRSGKATEDLRKVLSKIDSAKKLSMLIDLSLENSLDVLDVLRFKFESLYQETVEDFFVEAVQSLGQQRKISQELKEELYNDLVTRFSYFPEESRVRIYMKLLCGPYTGNTDNRELVRLINQLKSGGKVTEPNKEFFATRFLSQNARIAADNEALSRFIDLISALEHRFQNMSFECLRALYRKSRDSAKTWNDIEDGKVKEILEALYNQIVFPKISTQIPHIFYEPLLMLNSGDATLNIIRQLISAINENPGLRDQTATMKNRLYEKIILLSRFQEPDDKAGIVLSNIFNVLLKKYGPISIDNVEIFYTNLMLYLEQLTDVIDIHKKAESKEYQEDLNRILGSLSQEILDDLINTYIIDDNKLFLLKEKLKGTEAAILIAAFKKRLVIKNEAEAYKILTDYIVNNPRAKWVDHEGRSIYQLIRIYLATISDAEIYQNIWDALMAECRGEFRQWKYESGDYKKTIDEAIKIEINKMSEEERNEFDEAIADVQGNSLYDRLQKIEGFGVLKRRIEEIRKWEKALAYSTTEGEYNFTVEFTDDFYELFNIGNYPGSTACQSCVYGASLNRGLTGYLVNGTNKAIAFLDGTNKVKTRRIVRLKIAEDEQGNRQPVIFVEESTQFGIKGIDKLYAMLDVLSLETGLPVVVSMHKSAESPKVKEGKDEKRDILLFQGRSKFDYSDGYGQYVLGAIQAGLYRQDRETSKILRFPLLVKPNQAAAKDDIEANYGLVPEDRDGENNINTTLLIREVFDLRIAEFRKSAFPEQLRMAEADSRAHIVKILNPESRLAGELTSRGYFYKPSKISYELEIPQMQANELPDQALERYYAGFKGEHRRQFRRDVRNIDEAINAGNLELIEDNGDSLEYTKEFLGLYEKEMDLKARGRKPLLEAIRAEGDSPQDFIRNKRLGLYLRDKTTGKIIGGIIVKKFTDRYSISYAATDSEVRREIRNIQFYLVQAMIKKSIENKYAKLGYGVDTNLYGHHLNIGLMYAKKHSGFKPKGVKDAELMKIVDFEVFSFPVFFYNFGPSGELESTLIVSEDMVRNRLELEEAIKIAEGATQVLNIYILRQGQLIKVLKEGLLEIETIMPLITELVGIREHL